MLARVAWQFGAPHASMTGSSGFAAPWRPRRLAISMLGRRHQCQLLPALVISALMGASLGSKPYGEPCQCMERRSGPSSSSRREAHLPLQEDPARWSATTALELATLVLRHASGGQLWLAGLPAVATLEAFPAVTLQVICFSEPLERRGGIGCPGALCKVMAPTDKANRDRQWKEVWPLIRQTYLGGESTIIHCMAGTSQGGWNHRPRQIAASRLHTGGERLRHIQVAGHRILEVHEHPARGRVDLADFPPCNGGTSYASTGGLHGDRKEPASHPNSG